MALLSRGIQSASWATLLSLLLISARQVPATAATINLQAGCDLVAAIDSANGDTGVGTCTSGSGADTILLAADVNLNTVNNTDYYLGDNALPLIVSDITINGNGRTIRQTTSSDLRLFQIASRGSLALRHVTLESGQEGAGACVYVYGGNLDLYRTVIRNCTGYRGPGIYNNEGQVTIDESYFSGNLAQGPETENRYGAAIASFGGSLTIARSTFNGNWAFDDGGAVAFTGGALTIDSSTFSSNLAGDRGGALIVEELWWVPAAVVQITQSTFEGNMAGGSGGGISRVAGEVTATGSVFAGGFGGTCVGTIIDGGNNFGCAGGPEVTELDGTLADNGGPTLTHALLPGSNAIDAAGACGLEHDQRGYVRDASCDSGAYEYGDCTELWLQHDYILGFRSYQAPCSLRAGPSWVIGPEAMVAMTAGRQVVFENGFIVLYFGRLSAGIDPDLLVP